MITNRSLAPDCTTWKLHREVVLLAGWGRAILLQIAHPLVAQGVADHSGFAAERWARVGRLTCPIKVTVLPSTRNARLSNTP